MEVMDREKIYKSAISAFGVEGQLCVAIEEMSELIKEICKHNRHNENYMQIAEEIADVEIMLEQLKKVIFMCELEVDVYKEMKLKRLKERVGA